MAPKRTATTTTISEPSATLAESSSGFAFEVRLVESPRHNGTIHPPIHFLSLSAKGNQNQLTTPLTPETNVQQNLAKLEEDRQVLQEKSVQKLNTAEIDLALLFKLVSRVPNATDKLKEIVEVHIHQMGIDAIERISDSALNNPKLYVETILNIHTKFLKLVKEAFNSEQDFTTALDKACAKFINNNAVTITAGNTTKSPELLVQYCNTLLRKGGRRHRSRRRIQSNYVIFNYIENKDVFLKFYRKMFAKRLVGQLCASDDYEELMMSKLKLACGFDYTLELQQMFQDICISKTLTDQYRTYCGRNHIHDIVMVLKSNS
ncbi:unnamed protein product [Rotaria sordida]|uniref:Cullin family profile domain-containing protein n=1 Tax=Rotaria sordida TaxID=392033 RepID=A0A815KQN0_9BILA|nr:unnamed protein product [Rotaria sordida]CAF1622715.1 unnamed protein product [Rotaria sordida]